MQSCINNVLCQRRRKEVQDVIVKKLVISASSKVKIKVVSMITRKI